MSAYQFKQLSPEQYQSWFEANLPNLQFRSPFHQPAWLEAVSRGAKFGLGFLGAYENRELVMVFPGFVIRRGPFAMFGSPLRGTMTSYLGPVSLKTFDQMENLLDAIQAYNRYLRKQSGVISSRFTLRDTPPNGLPELDNNWKQERPRSYRLNLRRSETELWDSLTSNCRRNIRRALLEGIEIVQIDDAHVFYQMLDETLRRHGTTSWHSEHFFKLVMTELTARDLLWAWGARYKDEIIAVGLFFHDDREMHFISGASLPRYKSLPTSYLLHWQAILTASSAGLQTYNSDASRIRSIDQFKESFRPDLERRHTLIWSPKSVQAAQKWAVKTINTFRELRSKVK
jgi:hypothetical protein